ncbi:NAD(FAD)-utilizing dehydrogenase [Halobacillus shinanisalinarum]|uniref:NAD(FAD)-utilizing dehydrogenase n=1 Tax=Halobacillus shinanisalinarum TaxID=2932258 RepID=A0ABY4H5Q9_9BACI|nr:NAD(FAD)-utilizing dehydrogenase [Halobacillus shinanisalinarum]UOQ95783.1 NAD(FAD)-utilizing dehydrogenase [Halobacillus shinanisalinarum]
MNDITIIGAGVSSIFLAYTLMKENDQLSVHVIDRGKKLSERTCGLDDGKECTCEGGCSKYIGFAGLGKSEGKFNYTNDFGGDLAKKIGEQKALELMKEVDNILCSFGAGQVRTYSTKNRELSARAMRHSLKVLSTEVRHLGTSLSGLIFQQMYNTLKNHITFTFEADVRKLSSNEEGYTIETDRGTFVSNRLVLATGMSGSEWLSEQTANLGLYPGQTRLDLGMRVEMRGDQLDAILQQTFETKLKYEGEGYSATTYCMNPRGRIIRKHQHGLVMPDGQNQNEKDVPSANLNFTLFVPRYFNTYEKAINEGKRIIGNINRRQERIVVQRLEDLKLGQTTKDVEQNPISPSLKGEGGDLLEEVPSLYTKALLEFFSALEGLIEEPIDPKTLLYGMDAKFYEPKLYTNECFETEVPGLFLIGDCSGETHSLSQAAASGVYLGRFLAKEKL